MADQTNIPAAPENDHLAPAERAYFESRGEKAIPAPKPEPAQPELALDKPPPAAAAPEPPKQQPSEPSEPSDPAVPSAPAAKPERTGDPNNALAAERNRRREAEDRARAAELNAARLQERYRVWQEQAVQQQQRQPQPPPDPNRDIFGAVADVMRKQQATEQEIVNYKRQIAAQEQLRNVARWGAEHDLALRKADPNYQNALANLRTLRLNELQHGFGMNPMAANQQLVQEELELVVNAARLRRNPAEMAYAIAKARGCDRPAGNGNAANANANAHTEQQFDRVEAGQQASRSLSNVGGRASGGVEVSINDVLKMSDAELDAFKTRNPAKYRRLKGAAR